MRFNCIWSIKNIQAKNKKVKQDILLGIPLHLIFLIRNAEPYLTPAEKLTTGKKNPSVLKSSNMPWTGWPLILKDMLGAPKSRQQLTTSSEFSKCWLMEATALGIRPRRQWRRRGKKREERRMDGCYRPAKSSQM